MRIIKIPVFRDKALAAGAYFCRPVRHSRERRKYGIIDVSDKRLFDTRVPVDSWKLTLLESGQVFFTQSHKGMTGPVYYARQRQFYGNYLLFLGMVHEVSNNKVMKGWRKRKRLCQR